MEKKCDDNLVQNCDRDNFIALHRRMLQVLKECNSNFIVFQAVFSNYIIISMYVHNTLFHPQK